MALIERAQDGEITQEELSDQLQDLAAAAVLLWFLRGSEKTEDELTGADWQAIDEQIRYAQESARQLARDIESGRYETTDPETGDTVNNGQLLNRVAVWGTALLGVANIGMVHRRGNPELMWVFTPGKEHCNDCLDLNGTIRRASEWRAQGPMPQSRDLECSGYNCGCYFVEV